MGLIHNPDFPAEGDDFRRLVAEMRSRRRPAIRPVLILGGYRTPGVPVRIIAATLRKFADIPRDRLLVVSYPFAGSIASAVDKAMREIQRRGWEQTELDVIGLSMGGIVGRTLLARPDGPRAARLFTLASPHRGALLADRVRPDAAARDPRPGSGFLRSLDEALADRSYELICYATLRDWMVGATHSAPIGMHPIWLDPHRPGGSLLAHFLVNSDSRILADVARRLRGEPGFAKASPPPRD